MLLRYLAGALLATSTCFAQSTATEPCARVRSLLAGNYNIPASVAEECLLSAPIVENDALDILDGLTSMIEWQSTLAWLKDPPSDYPFPALDLESQLSDLRSQVSSGAITSEIVFERTLTEILYSAHDGHLTYFLDGIGVFGYNNGFGAIDLVSLDGEQDPAIYLHDELMAYAAGYARAPSAVTFINGVDSVDWITSKAQNQTSSAYQDVDAIFNVWMFQPITTADVGTSVGAFGYSYIGDSTVLKFANGTTANRTNYAVTGADFSNVFDGPSFSLEFCNATEKARRNVGFQTRKVTERNGTPVKRQEPTTNVTQLPSLPSPLYISPGGSISGYFLAVQGFEDTAVMVITDFPFDGDSFQTTLTDFLDYCRSEKKKRLVIDITGNGGGAVALVYEVFAQLFPGIEAYAAGNFRANDALNIIGSAVTGNAQKVKESEPGNVTAYTTTGGYSDWDGRAYNNASGSLFASWADYYGPVSAHGDNFTNLFRWPIDNTDFTEVHNSMVVTGNGNIPLKPQPFEPENIVIVGDGRCSSSCTSLSHLLKWQGKVKSIAVGGRPQTGPMQSQGGVKGSQVASVASLLDWIPTYATVEQLTPLADTKAGGGLTTYGRTMQHRTASGGKDSNQLSFNIKNNIAEGDDTYTPLHFVYEAADCKLYNRGLWVYDPSWKWVSAAEQAFGLNGTTAWSGCVKDSTGHSSSLSGNPDLFNNGVPNNVTTFTQAGTNADSGSGGDQNAGQKLGMPVFLTVVVAGVVSFII